MKRFMPVVMVFAVLFAFSTCLAAVGSDVPLPSDLKIVPPDSSVPAERAGFSGKWYGRWDNVLNHILVVEEIKGDNAVVIYAIGQAPSWKIEPKWERVVGEFKDGKVVLHLPSGATVTYRLKRNGTLDGEYERGRYFARGTMKRPE